MKKYLPNHSLKTVVTALILSRLDYCNSLLAGLPDTQINKLQKVQTRAAKLVLGCSKFDRPNTKDILKALHWLPVRARIDFKIALFCFKSLKTTTPTYISDLITYYSPTRELRSSDQHLLNIPITKLKNYGDRAFSKFGPTVWNSLPLSVRTAGSEAVFRKHLKTYLFEKYLL